MTLFQLRYRVESARHKSRGYHSPGAYFVTICTKNRVHYFGSVKNRQMVLSPVGKIAREELLKILDIRNNVTIDEWVIMPDHIHMIIGSWNAQTIMVNRQTAWIRGTLGIRCVT